MEGTKSMKSLLTIFFLLGFFQVNAAKLFVGNNKTYKTITAALYAAKPDDSVLVEAGTYHEKNLVISKRIYLIGKGYPVLDGENRYEVISIKADGVTVEGFRIIRSGHSSIIDMGGVKIYDSKHVTIQNNILEDTFFGIYLQFSSFCIIRNNRITAHAVEEQQSGNGIHCWKSDSLLIIGNTITGHRDGIYFEFVTGSTIWRNDSHANLRYGLHFMFSHNNVYITNIFRNNGAGVAVMYSHGVKMFNNFFLDNWGDAAYGLLLKEISDSHIEGNHFGNNTMGIYMEGASRIMAIKNSFENNGWGMKIQASCMDVTVVNNNFTGNSFDVATNGSLVLNTFKKNYWDKYEGYDLNKDGTGDIPYRPVSMFSVITEKNPPAMMLFRSFITSLMDKTEKVLPSLTPENLKDEQPSMKRLF
jgi:nitrous oxidase accessory protein